MSLLRVRRPARHARRPEVLELESKTLLSVSSAPVLETEIVAAQEQPLLPVISNEAYVTNLYYDILNRAPDAGGLAFFTDGLDSGLMTRGQAVWTMLTSGEYVDNLIDSIYQDFLGRDADAAGIDFWSNFLASGGTSRQMEALVLSSPEYFETLPELTIEDYVTALYNDVLGRAPDPDAVFWVDVLERGVSPTVVASSILNSAEANTNFVRNLFANFLNRPPDVPAGLNWWISELQGDLTTSQAIARVATSPEYVENAATATLNVVEIIEQVPEFSTLMTLITAAGVADPLAEFGPWTIFAPTNDAFAALPAGTVDALLQPENHTALLRLLSYHVVEARFNALQVVQNSPVTTAEGAGITAEFFDFFVLLNADTEDFAFVIVPNILASNGVIHAIDAVLIPPPLENFA